MDEEVLYEPSSEEVDRSSKVSLIEHISHRLNLSECLEYEANGHLDTKQMASFSIAVIHNMGFDIKSPSEIRRCLLELRERLEQDKYLEDLDYLDPEDDRLGVYKLKKPQQGEVIAGLLGFSYEGNLHIGTKNGVVSRTFLEDVLDKLEIPRQEHPELLEDLWKQLKRPPIKIRTASELNERLDAPDRDSWEGIPIEEVAILIPDFQRHSDEWGRKKKEALIDSMLRDIPMPSVFTGRSDPSSPLLLIDGQQRLVTVQKALMDAFTFRGLTFSEMPDWAQKRILNYRWNVEHVEASDDRQLAALYDRLNSSGKSLSSVQIRLAKHYCNSALHHLILALSGGPDLKYKQTTRKRLGISEHIDRICYLTNEIRDHLPRIGKHKPDERRQVRRSTEKTYDILCRIVGYSTYRSRVPKRDRRRYSNSDTDTPTTNVAANVVLHHFKEGGSAIEVVDRLYSVVSLVRLLFGRYAFVNLKKFTDEDENERWDAPKRGLAGVFGWTTQIQCASLWDRDNAEIEVLLNNPDLLKSEWKDFVVSEIIDKRQNSKTLWLKQELWDTRLNNMISKLSNSTESSDSSTDFDKLNDMVIFMLEVPDEETRDLIKSTWNLSFKPTEIEYMLTRLDQLSQ
jgi:hypothetical protein